MRPEAVVEVLRVIIAVLGAYLVIVTAAGIALRLARAHLAAALVDRVTPVLVRRLVASVVGASLAMPGMASAQQPSPDPPIVMHRLDEASPATTTTTTFPVPDIATESGSQPVAAPPADRVWMVEPGQHFWSIAETVVGGALGRTGTDAEVAPYWLELVETNRGRLVDRTNDDLIYPGQQFVVPPVADA